jgi:hypothetical protein
MAQAEPEINLPDELVAGVYATWVGVWYTPHEFVVDFAVQEEDEMRAENRTPVRVVSRVRLPTGTTFEALATIRAKMAEYEQTFGEIRVPRPRFRQGDE